ncbi:MAG: hypothetical protein Kow0088_09670 [Anaerolineales bacterium]
MRFRFSYFLLLVLSLASVLIPLPDQTIEAQDRAFEINARQFSYSPSELKVNRGDIVTIRLVSTDVVHGLYLDGYDLFLEAEPGQSATLTFVADKPGSFRFRCNVSCGALHPFMLGKLTVGSNEWLLRAFALSILVFLALMFLQAQNIKRWKLGQGK